MKITRPFIYILHEQRSQLTKYIDGISGKLYTFVWEQNIPELGCAYVYEPKSQHEIDDIFESQQRYQIYFYSMYFPGMFAQPETAKKEEAKEPEKTEPPKPEPIDFAKVADGELSEKLDTIEDKDILIALIEEHEAKAPAKQSKIESFRAAAVEAILDFRAKQDAGEDDNPPEEETDTPTPEKEAPESTDSEKDIDI